MTIKTENAIKPATLSPEKQQGAANNVKAQQPKYVRQTSRDDVPAQLDVVYVNEGLDIDQKQEEDDCDMVSDVGSPPDPTIIEVDATSPEAHAVAVDELREAKMMEIFNAPLVEAKLLSPIRYAKWMLPMSMMCALLSCVAIAGMAIFVFVVDPYSDDNPLQSASTKPSDAPADFSNTGGFSPDMPILPESNESDGPQPLEPSSSSSTTPLFVMLIAAIALTSLFAVGFFISFRLTRTQHSRKQRSQTERINEVML